MSDYGHRVMVEFDGSKQRLKCPFKDFKGNDLYQGDFVRHPISGETAKIFCVHGDNDSDKWRCDYSDGSPLSRLILQTGDKGQAEKVAEDVEFKVRCFKCGGSTEPLIFKHDYTWLCNNCFEAKRIKPMQTTKIDTGGSWGMVMLAIFSGVVSIIILGYILKSAL